MKTEKLKNLIKQSQHLVKVLDMPVKDSLIGGKIENTNTARENEKNLQK